MLLATANPSQRAVCLYLYCGNVAQEVRCCFWQTFFCLTLSPALSECRPLVFKLSKGYRGRGNNVFSVAKPRVTKALQKAYIDRKRKKREMRSIWITQVNAGARLYGQTYSGLICGLKQANVLVDRKILSELAMFEPYSFRALTLVAEKAGGPNPNQQIGDPRYMVPKSTPYDEKS